MYSLDPYVIDVLMRDLVGHDRRPASFLVYLLLSAEQARRDGPVEISYEELAENARNFEEFCASRSELAEAPKAAVGTEEDGYVVFRNTRCSRLGNGRVAISAAGRS